MGKYNFENGNNEFDKTIVLGDLNKEIKLLEAEKMQETKPVQIVKPNRSYEKRTAERRNRKKKKNDVKILTIIAVAVLFIGIFCVSALAVRNIFTSESKPTGETIENAEDVFDAKSGSEMYVIKAFKKNIVYLLDTESGKVYSATTDDNTVITGSNGGKIQFDALAVGDVVSVVKNEKTGTASQIRWAEEAWKKENKGDVRVDVDSSSVTVGEEIYKYNANTLFVYKGKEISPEDISYADVVNVTGVKNNVSSITVMKRHGYVYFKNADYVDSIMAKVDFGEEYDVSGGKLIIPDGTHTIIVSGTNIEDYLVEVTVSDTQHAEIDMELAKEKTANLVVDVKPEGSYKLTIDDEIYPDGTRNVELPAGEYTVKVNREGYEEYVEKVKIKDKEVVLNIGFRTTGVPVIGEGELYGNITIYSEPGWAKIYIDGVYKGVTPYMIKLPYGEHYIKLMLDGYEPTGKHVIIDKPEQTYWGVIE